MKITINNKAVYRAKIPPTCCWYFTNFANPCCANNEYC